MGCCYSKDMKKYENVNKRNNFPTEDDIILDEYFDTKGKFLISTSFEDTKMKMSKSTKSNSFSVKSLSKDKFNHSVQTSEDDQFQNLILNDSIRNFKNFVNSENLEIPIILDSDNPNVKITEIETSSKNIIQIYETDNDDGFNESVKSKTFPETKNDTKFEISAFNSNFSSASIKKPSNSNNNSMTSHNSNCYVDKNSILKLVNKHGENIKLSHSSSDNYNSNFTFNYINSQTNNDTSSNNPKSNKSVELEYNANLDKKDQNRKKSFTDDIISQNFILKNYFAKKIYAFILLEINNFCFTQKEYFKNIYPEINLVLVVEINDCILSQEKIFFYRSDDGSNSIYFPYLKKEDLKYNKYRIIKPIEMNDEEFPIKISVNFYTFTNYKLLSLGSEEIFLTLKREKELQKYNFYHNIHMKFINKKIGNLFFNLAYNIDEIYPNQLLEEINKGYDILSNLKTMRKFEEEEHNLIFIYYNIFDDIADNEETQDGIVLPNFDEVLKIDEIKINNKEEKIIKNRSSNYMSNHEEKEKMNIGKTSMDKEEKVMNFSMKEPEYIIKDYFSIEQINKTEISQELKNSEITVDRFLQLVKMSLSNQEFYILFKKVNQLLNLIEFTLEKMNVFKQKINEILRKFSETYNPSNVLVIPTIFSVLKRAFYKLKKDNVNLFKNYNLNNSGDSGKKNFNQIQFKYRDDNEKKNHVKNGELLLESIKTTCSFLDANLHEDISISALNYLYKFFEEPIHFEYDDKVNVTDSFLLEVILQNKIYILLCEILIKYPEYQACVHPCLDIIFRIIKNKKNQSQELIKIINTENFMTVIYIIIHTHECNMKIMTNVFSILCLINDKIDYDNFCSLFSFQKLREIFNIYKMNGFEMIHEIIIHLVRNLVNKKQEFRKKFFNNIGQKNEDLNQQLILNDDEVLEILLIFLNSIQWMKNRIALINDLKKSSRYIFNIINNIFIICNVIVIILENNIHKIQVINNFRLIDCIINIILMIRDTGLFKDIDIIQGNQDMTSLSNKVLILKKIFFCNKIIQMTKNKFSVFKDNISYKNFENFMDYFLNEKIYNPTNIANVIKGVFYQGGKPDNKSDKSEQVKKSILHVEFMYNELKNDYK